MVKLPSAYAFGVNKSRYRTEKVEKNWRVLHRSIYPLTLLILLHYALEEKIGESAVVYWVVLSLVLLLHRVWFNWRKVRANVYDDGMVAKR